MLLTTGAFQISFAITLCNPCDNESAALQRRDLIKSILLQEARRLAFDTRPRPWDDPIRRQQFGLIAGAVQKP